MIFLFHQEFSTKLKTINAKIINYSDKEQIVTLSIKEAMQILQKYSLLPDEISINEDKSNISVSKNLKSHPLMLTSELANLKQGQGIVKYHAITQ